MPTGGTKASTVEAAAAVVATTIAQALLTPLTSPPIFAFALMHRPADAMTAAVCEAGGGRGGGGGERTPINEARPDGVGPDARPGARPDCAGHKRGVHYGTVRWRAAWHGHPPFGQARREQSSPPHPATQLQRPSTQRPR